MNAQAPVIIRTATPDDIPGMARVHVDSWRTTYKGIVSDEYLAKLSYDNSAARQKQQMDEGGKYRIMLVATQDERVIGFASGGPERDGHPQFTGELYAIYLFREVQGMGTGRLLFNEMASRLVALGHNSLLIWVLTQNPAREFYRKMGGERVSTKIIKIGGDELEEEAYGWTSLISAH